MACLPMTPTSSLVYDSDYVAYISTINPTLLAAGKALYSEVAVLPIVNTTTSQICELSQLHIRETAASGTAKKGPLQVLFYATTSPVTPIAGTTYNASVTNLVAIAKVATADYQRIADGATPIYEAVVKPAVLYKTGSSSTNVTSLYAVLLADGAVTYGIADTHSIRILTRQHEQVAG